MTTAVLVVLVVRHVSERFVGQDGEEQLLLFLTDVSFVQSSPLPRRLVLHRALITPSNRDSNRLSISNSHYLHLQRTAHVQQ